jgi:hypothetical protein
MRVVPEYALAQAAAAYLTATLDAIDFETWPIVTWFDPMAQDESNRVVCIVEGGETMAQDPASFSLELSVGVKTQWAQPSVATDMANHFDRTNQVRDVLNTTQDTLLTGLIAACPAGFSVSYVNQSRQLTTQVNQANYWSEIKLTVKAHAIT